MYSQKEIDDIKNKRRRFRNDSETKNDDPNDSGTSKHPNFEEEADINKLDEEFVDEIVKMAEKDDKEDDAWLNSLKTSETDDTQKVFEPKKVAVPERSLNIKSLYELARVEVIRLLVSKLQDGQSPADYIRAKGHVDMPVTTGKEPSSYEVADLAHVLTLSWQNVYFMTREDIVESLLNYKNNKKETKQYEFRWVKDELAVHGPYTHEDILMWIVYGYVSEDNPILVRELDAEGNPRTMQWTNYRDSDIFNIFPPSKEMRPQSPKLKPHNEREEDYDEFEDEEGFVKRKKPKLIGVKHKDRPEEYDESDEDQVE